MARSKKWEGVGEPLFGEDWWQDDQRPSADSPSANDPALGEPGSRRRPARLREQASAAEPDVQGMLPWFDEPSGAADEPLRGDSPAALAQWLPQQYAAIEDRSSFFSDLGSRASDRIDELAGQFAGDSLPGEGYLDRVGRLGQARRQAEEIVLSEMILLEPEPGTEED